MWGGGFLKGQEKCKIYSSAKLHKCNILHLFGGFFDRWSEGLGLIQWVW